LTTSITRGSTTSLGSTASIRAFWGEYRYNKFPQVGNEFPRGQFFFQGNYTQVNSVTNAQSGGYSGADFLLGTTSRVDIAVALAQPISVAANGQLISMIAGK